MGEPTFLFDVRVDFPGSLSEITQDVQVCHPKARVEFVRTEHDYLNGLRSWAVVTIRDKGKSGQAKKSLTILAVRRSENGFNVLPEGARFVGQVKEGLSVFWAFFELDTAARGSRAAVSAEPPAPSPRSGPSPQSPCSEPPPSEPDRIF